MALLQTQQSSLFGYNSPLQFIREQYGKLCSQPLREADDAFIVRSFQHSSLLSETAVDIFEHC